VYRRLASITLGVALAMGMVGIAAAPASAATAQSCAKFVGTITLSPGLGTAPANQKVTIKGAQSACKPTTTTGGTGAFLAQFTLKNASCGTLAKGGTSFTAPAKTTWKNKKTTSYTITYKDGTGANIANITMTGKATLGLFKGKKFAGGLKINLNSVNSNACTGANFKSAKLTQLKTWTLS
jgi:hypothetical protein